MNIWVGTGTDREGMITLNVVIIIRRNCEEVESVLSYGFTDLNM